MTDAHFYMVMTGLLTALLAVNSADLFFTVRHVIALNRGNGSKRKG